MLKLSLKQGQYVNIGDDIRVVYVGGSGGQGRLMIDAPKEVPIVRSSIEENPERRKDTYYPEKKISAKHRRRSNGFFGMNAIRAIQPNRTGGTQGQRKLMTNVPLNW